MIDATIELGSACPSTGWVYMLWTAHMWMLAQFPLEAQEELWSNPNTLASSVVNTVGEVVPVDGGYRWTGRGFFSSGVDHCNWLTASVPIKREEWRSAAGAPLAAYPTRGLCHRRRLVHGRPEGHRQQDHRPERRLRSRTSHARGQAGRGGHGARPGDPLPSDVRRDLVGQLYRGDGGAGAWRRARLPGAYEDRLRSKSSNIDDGLTVNMARYAQRHGQCGRRPCADAAECRAFCTRAGTRREPRIRAKCRRDKAFTAQAARKAVNLLYEECGGSGLYEKSDLQRLWRDTNAAAAHNGLTNDWIAVGDTRTVLGLPVSPKFLF